MSYKLIFKAIVRQYYISNTSIFKKIGPVIFLWKPETQITTKPARIQTEKNILYVLKSEASCHLLCTFCNRELWTHDTWKFRTAAIYAIADTLLSHVCQCKPWTPNASLSILSLSLCCAPVASPSFSHPGCLACVQLMPVWHAPCQQSMGKANQ